MLKKLVLLFLMAAVLLPLSAQKKTNKEINQTQPVTVSDKMPAFPGGQNALMAFISKNLRYPIQAQQKGIEGRSIIRFVVDKEGGVKDFKVVRSAHELLDNEAVRVLKTMPKWIPGELKGEKVEVYYTVPVMFRLTGDQAKKKTCQPMICDSVYETRRITLDKKSEITNKSLTGIWQACSVKDIADKYSVSLTPVLKIYAPDHSFFNIRMSIGAVPSSITIMGHVENMTESSFVENMDQSVLPSFTKGTTNKITYEFLNNNLVKFTFDVPNCPYPWVEYWYRLDLSKEPMVPIFK